MDNKEDTESQLIVDYYRMINKETYPKEFFINFENDLYREGRLIVCDLDGSFSVEVDIVQKDGKKIWYHVGQFFSLPSEKEAVEEGVQRLSEFLNRFE